MIILDKEFIGMKDYGKLFQVVKNGGFIKIGKNFGLNIVHHNGYIETNVCVLGEEINSKVYFNEKTNQYIPKRETKEVVLEVEATPQETETKEIDLFGD